MPPTTDLLALGGSAALLYRERMRLSREAIQEFKKIAKEEFGEELSDREAEECALNLLQFAEFVLNCISDSPNGDHRSEEEKLDDSS